jgi:hypothetical protein
LTVGNLIVEADIVGSVIAADETAGAFLFVGTEGLAVLEGRFAAD